MFPSPCVAMLRHSSSLRDAFGGDINIAITYMLTCLSDTNERLAFSLDRDFLLDVRHGGDLFLAPVV